MGASSGGIEPGRVAEIIAGRRRGSGYRIGQTTVLTAAHVIEDEAAPVVVRFDADQPGEWSVTATSLWADAESDLAVLTIPTLDHAPAVEAVRFGRPGDRDAVIEARAMGFPLFKLKNYDGSEVDAHQVKERYRDSHQAIGSIAVLSNRRERTLELTVAPPGPDPDPTVSPWQGMSGAAVWVGDEIVGVISEHHRSDGLGRLAAARLDCGLDRLDSAGKAQLRALVGLPQHGWQLRDVIPAEPAEVVTTAYHELVADIAPDRLYGREDELGELVRFCAGGTPYAWWQAGPWAGKSALMSWLVLYPPTGVDVVSFFVTGRLSGESDSAAFTAALIEQLTALAGESPAGLLTRPGQHGQLLALLKTVAGRSQQAHRRLLLVVDGLDEDTSTRAGRPSIASLLPRRPPPEVRVLVASRPHPPLPDDVPGDHPLRNVLPRPLAPSPYARGLELQAKHELLELLAGSPLQQQVLGYITASGGGLTLPDLEQLTGRAPFELNSLLGGVFGRSVASRSATPGLHRTGERVYLFAHETLQTIAEQQFGGTLAGYRDRIHRWADGWRERGWPPDTPPTCCVATHAC
jgi:Trypsin-like peptidase domain